MRTVYRIFLPLLILASFTYLKLIETRNPDTPEGSGAGGGEASYSIIPFMPDGSDSVESVVSDLNERGQAVGWIREPDATTRGLHLDISSGKYTLLSGRKSTSAGGVNNLNQIAGSDRGLGAFWAAPTEDPVTLSPLPGHVQSSASRINDAGIVIGDSQDDSFSPSVPVVWRVTVDHKGVPQVAGPWPLESLPGATNSRGVGLNEVSNGTAQVVGWSVDSMERAALWTVSLNEDDGTLTTGPPASLGTLGMIHFSWSFGTDINDSGVVCGISDYLPFYTTADSPLQPLFAPLQIHRGHPESINEAGETVGWVDVYGENQAIFIDLRACLWRNCEAIELKKEIDANSGWHDLNTANCINDDGIIGGTGIFDVERRGFLLIPREVAVSVVVPKP